MLTLLPISCTRPRSRGERAEAHHKKVINYNQQKKMRFTQIILGTFTSTSPKKREFCCRYTTKGQERENFSGKNKKKATKAIKKVN